MRLQAAQRFSDLDFQIQIFRFYLKLNEKFSIKSKEFENIN